MVQEMAIGVAHVRNGYNIKWRVVVNGILHISYLTGHCSVSFAEFSRPWLQTSSLANILP